jgi:hypothetical protein
MVGVRKGICLLLLLAVVSAQPAALARQADGAFDPWLIRARSLTDELLKDSDALGRYDRALLLARLGKEWRQSDGERAQAWIEKAVQAVESAPDKEDAGENSRRLSAARSLLVILGAQDKSLSARLNKVLSPPTETTTAFNSRENAKAKAEAGLAVVDSDPQRALQFGMASLRAGGSYKLASLIWRLRKRDVNLSDTLFMEVLAAARARNYDPNLFNILPVVAFEGPSASEKLRGSLLSALAEGLLRPVGSPEEQSAVCKLAPTAAPLLPEFQRLLPQQAAMVSAQISRCQPSLDPSTRREVGDALQDKPLNTVDDLLAAAGKASDPEQRVTYLNRAAYMAFGERKYESAISILDGFSSEERELANKTTTTRLWDNWRSAFASEAAAAHAARNDRPAMYRIIADTPAPLRPSVQMSAAAELAKRDAPAATELLDEARAALAKQGSSRNFDAYLTLVRRYAALRQSDALPVLGEAIKAMNRAEQFGQDADDAEAQIPLLSNDILLGRYALPVGLLEQDDVGTRQAIASAESPARRAAMRLSLLKASLERRRTAAPKPLTTEPKGQNNATL